MTPVSPVNQVDFPVIFLSRPTIKILADLLRIVNRIIGPALVLVAYLFVNQRLRPKPCKSRRLSISQAASKQKMCGKTKDIFVTGATRYLVIFDFDRTQNFDAVEEEMIKFLQLI